MISLQSTVGTSRKKIYIYIVFHQTASIIVKAVWWNDRGHVLLKEGIPFLVPSAAGMTDAVVVLAPNMWGEGFELGKYLQHNV